jgi:FKBP-type peptidyl-prolyl cis-trans isomerase (trigger factor)
LRERLRAAVEAETVAATDARVQEALTELLATSVQCAVPASVLREIGEGEYQAELLKLQASGRFSMEQVARLATPDLLQKFIDARKDTLEGLHRAQRAVEELFEKEGLKVDEDAAQAEYDRAVADFQASGSEFDADRLREQVAETMKGAAVIEWLKQVNTMKVGPVEPPKRSFGG